MSTSPQLLYNYFEGNGKMYPAIINDLFGYANWTSFMKSNRDDVLTLFLGLYKGLYLMGITPNEIYRCFLQNKLDDLIHIKYSVTSSGYYNVFCGKSVKNSTDFENQMVGNPIKIGNTFFDLRADDDICQTSNEIVPLIYTIQPSFVPIKNSLTDIDILISKKIMGYKHQDSLKTKNNPVFSITDKYVTVADVKNLLHKQEEKCYVCGDVVSVTLCENLTDINVDDIDVLLRHINNLMSGTTHTSKCMYQFTLDRIDNKLPHNRDNVLICCQYCNCFGETDKQQEVEYRVCKMCPNKCHTIKRNIPRTRRDVSKIEIQKLLQIIGV
jgi:hypothetical protein